MNAYKNYEEEFRCNKIKTSDEVSLLPMTTIGGRKKLSRIALIEYLAFP